MGVMGKTGTTGLAARIAGHATLAAGAAIVEPGIVEKEISSGESEGKKGSDIVATGAEESRSPVETMASPLLTSSPYVQDKDSDEMGKSKSTTQAQTLLKEGHKDGSNPLDVRPQDVSEGAADVSVAHRTVKDKVAKYHDDGGTAKDGKKRKSPDSSSSSSTISTVASNTEKVYIVHMRVLDPSSTPSVPQAAFSSQRRARAYALRVFKFYCNCNYGDYVYYGPRQLGRGAARKAKMATVEEGGSASFRYTARHGQSGKRLVVVDVVDLDIVEGEEDEDEDEGEEGAGDDEHDKSGKEGEAEDSEDAEQTDEEVYDMSDWGSTFEVDDGHKVLNMSQEKRDI